MNKFEQVSSVGHQMSVVGAGTRARAGTILRLMSRGLGTLHSEVQGIMGNGHMQSPSGQTEWQTHTTEIITFPQLHWQAVKIIDQYKFIRNVSLVGVKSIKLDDTI